MQKDDFWSIDKLLPKISSYKTMNTVGHTANPVSSIDPSDYTERRIFTQNSKVIKYYSVYTHKEYKNRYNKFIEDIENIPLVSNQVPLNQILPFEKLTKAQLGYYKFFKRTVKERTKIHTQFPYIVLFCLEIAIKESESEFDEDIESLFYIWNTYKFEYPMCEKLICDILLDHSFDLERNIDFKKYSDYFTSTEQFTLPFIYNEFVYDYLFTEENIPQYNELNFILSRLTRSNYKKSVAYRSNKLYSYCVDSAVNKSIQSGIFNDKSLNDTLLNISIPTYVKTKRKLYADLPICNEARKYIKISYYPLLFDDNIKTRTEDIIRYIDNKVRSELKIKNTLSRIAVPTAHKIFLDSIILSITNAYKNTEFKKAEEEVTEIKHPAKEINVNTESAKKIESDSWKNTEMLFDGIETEDEETLSFSDIENFDKNYKKEINTIENVKADTTSDLWEFAASLNESQDKFMRIAVNKGKEEARKFVSSVGQFYESFIAECNNKAEDTFGDIIFDSNCNLFNDYLDELKEVFPE